MKYFEEKNFTKKYRENYLKSLIDFSNSKFLVKKSDDKLINELGYPLNLEFKDIELVEKNLLTKEDNFSLYRCTFKILKKIKFTGLFFEIDKNLPLVFMQHGYLGTPEIMSNIYEDRNSSNYNDIVLRLLKQKVNVFCPQLLMWSINDYGVSYDRVELDNILRNKKSSLVATELYCLLSTIEYFSHKYKTIDFYGMSYGACMTYYLSLFSKKIRKYWACSYLITNTNFPELIFKTPFSEIIKKSFEKNELYITYGDKDPIILRSESREVIKDLDKKRIVEFSGNHEVYNNDVFLDFIIHK